MGLPVRTLQQLLVDQATRPVEINGLFKRQDQRIRQLESELATARRAVAFQNDVIEKLRQSYTCVPVVYRDPS